MPAQFLCFFKGSNIRTGTLLNVVSQILKVLQKFNVWEVAWKICINIVDIDKCTYFKINKYLPLSLLQFFLVLDCMVFYIYGQRNNILFLFRKGIHKPVPEDK